LKGRATPWIDELKKMNPLDGSAAETGKLVSFLAGPEAVGINSRCCVPTAVLRIDSDLNERQKGEAAVKTVIMITGASAIRCVDGKSSS